MNIGVCSFSSKIIEKFHLAEIQTTFYNIPREKTVQNWRNKVSEDFVFSFKVFQGITHNARSPTWRRYRGEIPKNVLSKIGDLKLNEITMEYWETMFNISKILSAKFMVVQTPASFKPTEENIKNAKETFSFLEEKIGSSRLNLSVAWEPRGSWLKNRDLLESIANDYPHIILTVDPLVDEPFVGGKYAYFRLHGIPRLNYKYRYVEKDYKTLLEVIKKLSEDNVEEFFVLFNNVYMVEDASNFKAFLGDKGWRVY